MALRPMKQFYAVRSEAYRQLTSCSLNKLQLGVEIARFVDHRGYGVYEKGVFFDRWDPM